MEDELDEPGAVAQVDEDQAAVVAAAVDPAGDPHLGVDPVAQHLAAPGVAKAVGAQGRRLAHGSPPVSSSISFAVSTGRCSPRGHVAQLRRAVGLEDQHAAGADPVGVLELALEAAPGEVELGREPGVAQLGRQRHRPLPALAVVGDGDEGVAPGRLLVLAQRQQDPLDPRRPADRRRRRPAELLDQPVVAAAAADLRLGAEASQTKEKIVRV